MQNRGGIAAMITIELGTGRVRPTAGQAIARSTFAGQAKRLEIFRLVEPERAIENWRE
jgi:hypothetical protein